VHCGANLDDRAGHADASIDAALDRAARDNVVVELYAHRPGVSVPVARIERVLAGARDRGLAFYTYADFAAGREIGPGLALAFDDHFVPEWHALRPVFQEYEARVTFFVSRYAAIARSHELLRELADDGHDVAAHSVLHLRAPSYVEEHGLAAYVADEVAPSISVLREAGYPVTAFAYPFGARTAELDAAILRHVALVRSVVFPYASSPCPR
jgi:peptidoglycan/xylan/chitin deacetylase (PgdA/CDA1 family)